MQDHEKTIKYDYSCRLNHSIQKLLKNYCLILWSNTEFSFSIYYWLGTLGHFLLLVCMNLIELCVKNEDIIFLS